MVSADYSAEPEEVKRRFDEAVKRIALKCGNRRALIIQINSTARGKGLDTTTAIVARHFTYFQQWYAGGLATGHLINRTGIKRIEQ